MCAAAVDDDDVHLCCATERAGHAHELVKDLVLADWYGIVIVSGDGLVFEVCFCVTVFSVTHWHIIVLTEARC